MSDEKAPVGGVIRVLGKLGLVNVPGQQEVYDPGPDARPNPNPETPGVASAEALAKLRADIGLDDPASAYAVFEGILLTLEDAIPDMGIRYWKALQLAKRQAVSAESIVQEFDGFRDRIEQQSGVLTATLEDFSLKKIQPKRAQCANVEAALRVSRQEVANLEAQLDELGKSIKAEEDSLAVVRENFAAAAGALTAELREKEQLFLENLNFKGK